MTLISGGDLGPRAPELIRRSILFALDVLQDLCIEEQDFVNYWSFASNGQYDWEQAEDKLVSEAALLILLSSRISSISREEAATFDKLLCMFRRYCQKSRHLGMITMHPQTIAGLTLVPAVLKTLGDAPDAYSKAVATAIRSEQALLSERLPFREMDRRWTAALMGGGTPSFVDLIPHSITRGSPQPAQMTRSDAYAYTHSIMYLTDFGMTVSEAVNYGRVRFVVDGYIMKYIAAFDLDLLGEMLIVACCIGAHDSPYYKLGRLLLAQIWNEFGIVPGPGFSPTKYEALNVQERRWYTAAECYHTTFVAGMLFSVEQAMEASCTPCAPNDTHECMLSMCAKVLKIMYTIAPMCVPSPAPPIREPEALERLKQLLPNRASRLINDSGNNRELIADLALAKVLALGDWDSLVNCCTDSLAVTTKPTFMALSAIGLSLERASIGQVAASIAGELGLPLDIAQFLRIQLPWWLFVLNRQVSCASAGR